MALNKNYDFNPNDTSWMDVGAEPGERTKLSKAMKFIFGAAKGLAIGTASGVFDKIKEKDLDKFEDFSDEIGGLREEAEKSFDELKKGFGEAVSAGKKLGLRYTESARDVLPTKVYRRLSRAFEEQEEETISPEARFESSLSSNLASIFGAQARQSAGLQRIALQSAETDRVLQAKYHKQDITLATVTGKSVASIDSFLHTTYVNYLKKDLELKYRSYNTATIIKNHIDKVASAFNKEGMIGELIRVSGMSDRKKSEVELEAINRSAASKLTTTDNYNKNFYAEVLENLSSTPAMIMTMFSTFGEMASMMPAKGVQDLTAPLARMFAVPLFNKLKSKLSQKHQTQIDNFLNKAKTKISLVNDDLGDLLKNKALRKNSFGASLRGSKNPLLNAIGYLIPEFQRDTIVENKASSNPTDPATFDNLTRESIISVIPEHLSRIGDQIEALAKSQGVVPDEDSQKVYDIRTHSLVTRAERRERNLVNMFGTKATRNERYHDNVNTFMRIIKAHDASAVRLEQENYLKEHALQIHMFMMRSARVLRGLDRFAIDTLYKLVHNEELSFGETDYVNAVFGKNFEEAQKIADVILNAISNWNDDGSRGTVNFQLVREINKRITELSKEQDRSDIARKHLNDMGMYDEGAYNYNYEGDTEFREKFRTEQFAKDAKGAGKLPEVYADDYDLEKLRKKMAKYDEQMQGRRASERRIIDQFAMDTGLGGIASIMPSRIVKSAWRTAYQIRNSDGESPFDSIVGRIINDKVKDFFDKNAKNAVTKIVPRYNEDKKTYVFQVEIRTILKAVTSQVVTIKDHNYTKEELNEMALDDKDKPNVQLKKLVDRIIRELGGDEKYAPIYSAFFWVTDYIDDDDEDESSGMIHIENGSRRGRRPTIQSNSVAGLIASIEHNVNRIANRVAPGSDNAELTSSRKSGSYKGKMNIATLHAEGEENAGVPMLEKVKALASDKYEKVKKSKIWSGVVGWIKALEDPKKTTNVASEAKKMMDKGVDPDTVATIATQAVIADKLDQGNEINAVSAANSGGSMWDTIGDIGEDVLWYLMGGRGSKSAYKMLKHSKFLRGLVKSKPTRLLKKSIPRAIKSRFLTGKATQTLAKGAQAATKGAKGTFRAVGNFLKSPWGKVAGGIAAGAMMGLGGSMSSDASWESTVVSTVAGAGAKAAQMVGSSLAWPLAAILAVNAAREGWVDTAHLKKTFGSMYHATKDEKGAAAVGNILNYLSFGMLKTIGAQKYIDRGLKAVGVGYVAGGIGEAVAAAGDSFTAAYGSKTDKIDNKALMEARAKLRTDVERGVEGAQAKLDAFERDIANGNYAHARDLAGIKEKTEADAWKRVKRAFSFTDPDDEAMSKEEIQKANTAIKILLKRDPSFQEFAHDFNEAIRSERWRIARRIVGIKNHGEIRVTDPTKVRKLSLVSKYMKQLKQRMELGDTTAEDKLDTLTLAICRGDTDTIFEVLGDEMDDGEGRILTQEELEKERERYQKRAASGDAAAAAKVKQLDEAIANYGKRISVDQEVVEGGYYTDKNGMLVAYKKESRKFTEQELKIFRERLRREAEKGNQAAIRKLDQLDDAIENQEWDRVEDIIGNTNVSGFSNSSSGIFSWFKRNLGGGDQSYRMDDAQIKATISRFKDMFEKTHSPIVEQRLKDFQQAVADENWPEARKISGFREQGYWSWDVRAKNDRYNTDNKLSSEGTYAKKYRLILDRVKSAMTKKNISRSDRAALSQLRDDMETTDLLELDDKILRDFEDRLRSIDMNAGLMLKDDVAAFNEEWKAKSKLIDRQQMLLQEIVAAQNRCGWFDYRKRSQLKNLYAMVNSMTLEDISNDLLNAYDEELRMLDKEAISTKEFSTEEHTKYMEAFKRKNNLIGNIDEVIDNTSWTNRSKLNKLKELRGTVESTLPEDLVGNDLLDSWDEELKLIDPKAHRSKILNEEEMKKQRELIKKKLAFIRMLDDAIDDKANKQVRGNLENLRDEVKAINDEDLTDSVFSTWQEEFKAYVASAVTVEEQMQRDVEQDKLVREKGVLYRQMLSQSRILASRSTTKKDEYAKKMSNMVYEAANALNDIPDKRLTAKDLETARNALATSKRSKEENEQAVVEEHVPKSDKIPMITRGPIKGAPLLTGQMTSKKQSFMDIVNGIPVVVQPEQAPVTSASSTISQPVATQTKTEILPAGYPSNARRATDIANAIVPMFKQNKIPGIDTSNPKYNDRVNGWMAFRSDLRSTDEFRDAISSLGASAYHSVDNAVKLALALGAGIRGNLPSDWWMRVLAWAGITPQQPIEEVKSVKTQQPSAPSPAQVNMPVPEAKPVTSTASTAAKLQETKATAPVPTTTATKQNTNSSSFGYKYKARTAGEFSAAIVKMFKQNKIPGIDINKPEYYDRVNGWITFRSDLRNTDEFIEAADTLNSVAYNSLNSNLQLSLAMAAGIRGSLPPDWWIMVMDWALHGTTVTQQKVESTTVAQPQAESTATKIQEVKAAAPAPVTAPAAAAKPASATPARDKMRLGEIVKQITTNSYPGIDLKDKKYQTTNGWYTFKDDLRNILEEQGEDNINTIIRYVEMNIKGVVANKHGGNYSSTGMSWWFEFLRITIGAENVDNTADEQNQELARQMRAAMLHSGANEQAISFDANGNIVDFAEGGPTSVSIKTVPGGSYIHNHPDGTDMSRQDVAEAVRLGQKNAAVIKSDNIFGRGSTRPTVVETVNTGRLASRGDTAELHSTLGDMLKGVKDSIGSVDTNRDVLVGIYERLGDVIDAVSEHNDKVNDRIDVSTLKSYDLARRFTLKMTQKAKDVATAFKRPSVINISK